MKKNVVFLVLFACILGITGCGKHEHSVVIDNAIQASCTETGLSEGTHCSDCGEIITAQRVISQTDHVFTDGTCSVCGTADPNADTLTLDRIFNKDYNILNSLTLSDEIMFPQGSSVKRGVGDGERLYKGITDVFGVEGELYVTATSDRITFVTFYVDVGYLMREDMPFSEEAVSNQAKNTVNIAEKIIDTFDNHSSHSYKIVHSHFISITNWSTNEIQLSEMEDLVKTCYPTAEAESQSRSITIVGTYNTCDYTMDVSLSQYDTPGDKWGHIVVLNIE